MNRTLAQSIKRGLFFGSILSALAAVLLFSIVMGLGYLRFVRTDYSFNFSEAAFDSVQMGDSVDAVFQKLGEPLKVVVALPNRNDVWLRPNNSSSFAAIVRGVTPFDTHATHVDFDYTEQADSRASYLVRALRFGPQGTVESKHSGLYED